MKRETIIAAAIKVLTAIYMIGITAFILWDTLIR
jgi:hypothetical protein